MKNKKEMMSPKMMAGGKVKTYAKGGKMAMPMKGMKKPKSSSCK